MAAWTQLAGILSSPELELAETGGGRARRLAGWALVALPAAIAITQTVALAVRSRAELRELTHAPALTEVSRDYSAPEVPAELRDPHAWIWADMTTGTFWFYFRKAAFRIQYTDAETRRELYSFAQASGGAQYLVRDLDGMDLFMREIEGWGGRLEADGKAFGYPVYRIRWPELH